MHPRWLAKKIIYKINDIKNELEIKNDCPHGISYLHLQTLSESGDKNGSLIKFLDMAALD